MNVYRLILILLGCVLILPEGPVRALSDEPSQPGFRHGRDTLEEELGRLVRYEVALLDLRRVNENGRGIRLQQLDDLDARFTVNALQRIEAELHEIYRIELLIARLEGHDDEAPKVTTDESMDRVQPEPAPGNDATPSPQPEPPAPEPPPEKMPDKPVTPSLPDDIVKLGDSYVALGDYEKALGLYLELKDREKRPRVLYQVALCYERLRHYAEAKTEYERLVKDYGDTYWGKQAEWALNYVNWKDSAGELEESESIDETDGEN